MLLSRLARTRLLHHCTILRSNLTPRPRAKTHPQENRMFRNISPRLSTIAFLFSGLLSLTLLLPTNSLAQVVSGTITGTVTDPSSAVIANAHVLVHNDDIGVQRSLTTSSAGTFTAPAIPIGSYSVSVDASGFGSYKRTGISLTVGQTLNLNLSLKITGSESITVQDVPPSHQSVLRPDLRAGGRAPGQRASAERPQLRPATSAEPRHGELHQPALRQHGHFELLGRQHVLGLRTPPAGQSLPAEWH